MSSNATLSEPKNLKKKHPVVPPEEWIEARRELLKKEKEAVRLLDRLGEERRKLPWVKVDKNYVFESGEGKVTLTDLFAGRSQLVVYHFMFGPDWQEGCPSCSYVADHFNGAIPHLAARDVTMVAVSRAPWSKIDAFQKRLGWQFRWVSSQGSDFNPDFHVSFSQQELAAGKVYYNYTMQEFPSAEAPGLSVFYKDAEGEIYHTYSTYGRGLESMLGTYAILDMVPKGRDEDDLSFPMAWVRYHDRYESNQFADADKPYWPEEKAPAVSSCGCGSAKA